MISKDLKEILDLSGGRYIIVENGKPKYIIMNFEEYRSALLQKKQEIKSLSEKELVEKINADIAFWRESKSGPTEALADEIEKIEDIEYVS